MKKLQSSFTNPEQSKRLLELGVPEWTADCFYKMDLYSFKTEMCFTKEDNLLYHYTPCWSVGRLMEIYSICIKDDAGEYWPLHSSVESVGFTFIEHVIKRFVIDDIDLSKLKDYGIAE